jgi:hypothetical protein
MLFKGKVGHGLLTWLFMASFASAQDGVTQSFRLVHDRVTLHEPVLVEFALANGSSQGIETDLGFNRKQNFSLTITTPDRRKFTASPIAAEGFGATGQISVRPGETYRQVLLLNERYNFEAPGDYAIDARLTGAIKTVEKKPVVAAAPLEMRLTILPRDAPRLTEVCGSLAETAIHGSTYVEARDAALALSYVRDPVAVPFLARTLRESKLVRSEAADGLARIATPEAVEVLNASANSSDSELNAIARSALAVIDRKNKEGDIRK